MEEKYGKKLVGLSILLLLIFLINFVVEVWIWQDLVTEIDYPILSLLCIWIVLSKNNIKKLTIVISIVLSFILIIESVIDLNSIFAIVYLIIGVVNLIISILYLKQKNKKQINK